MSPSHLQDIDCYWSIDLALPHGFDPMAQEVHVIAQELYAGVQFFQREDWLVIAAPPQCVDRITERVRGVSMHEVFTANFVERLLSPDVGRIIGPAHIGYADSAMFRTSPTEGCRLLTPEDAAQRRALAEALSAEELEQSGFDPHEAPAFGAFAEGILCAVASYEIWEPRIAHITVATHPAHRHCGHGRAAVSALAGQTLTRGFVLQYRALAANPNSQALGRSLGFEHYCSTLFARPASA